MERLMGIIFIINFITVFCSSLLIPMTEGKEQRIATMLFVAGMAALNSSGGFII